jgi:hypothetical protein
MKTQDMGEASAQPENSEILGDVGTTPSILLQPASLVCPE